MANTLECGSSNAFEPRIVKGSRLKALPWVLLGGGFLAASLLVIYSEPSNHVGWTGLVLSALAILIFAEPLVRPYVLILDVDGFSLGPSILLPRKTVAWRDVQNFFVHRTMQDFRVVAYNLESAVKPTARHRGARIFGVDGTLPRGWPKSPEKMVEELNAYREWALSRR